MALGKTVNAVIMVLMVLSNTVLVGIAPYITQVTGPLEPGEPDDTNIDSDSGNMEMAPPEPSGLELLAERDRENLELINNITRILEEQLSTLDLDLLAVASISGTDLIQLTERGEIRLVNDTSVVRYTNDFRIDVEFRIDLANVRSLLDNNEIKDLSIVVVAPRVNYNTINGKTLPMGWVVYQLLPNGVTWTLHNITIPISDDINETIELASANMYYYIFVTHKNDFSQISDIISDLLDDGVISGTYNQNLYMVTMNVTTGLEDMEEKHLPDSTYASPIGAGDVEVAREEITALIEDVVAAGLRELLIRDVILVIDSNNTENLGPLYQVLANSLQLQDCNDPDSGDPSRFYSLSLGDIADILAEDLIQYASVKLASDKIYTAAQLRITLGVDLYDVVYNVTGDPVRPLAVYLDKGNTFTFSEVISDPDKIGGYRPSHLDITGLAEQAIEDAILRFSQDYLLANGNRRGLITDVADLSNHVYRNGTVDNTQTYPIASYIGNMNTGDPWEIFREFWHGIPMGADVAQVYGVYYTNNNTGTGSISTNKAKLAWGDSIEGVSALLLNLWDIAPQGDNPYLKRLYDPAINVKAKLADGAIDFIADGQARSRLAGSVRDTCLLFQEDDEEAGVRYSVRFYVEVTAVPMTSGAEAEVRSSEAPYNQVAALAAQRLIADLEDEDLEPGYLAGVEINASVYSHKVTIDIDLDYEDLTEGIDRDMTPTSNPDYLILPALAPKGGTGLTTKIDNIISSVLAELSQNGGSPAIDATQDAYNAVKDILNSVYSLQNTLGVDLMPFPTYIPIPIGYAGGANNFTLLNSYPTAGSLGYVMPGEYLGAIILTNEYNHTQFYKAAFSAIDPISVSLASVYMEMLAVEIEQGYVDGSKDRTTIYLGSIAVGLGPEDADKRFGKRLYMIPSTHLEAWQGLPGIFRDIFNNVLGPLGVIDYDQFESQLLGALNDVRGIYIQVTPYVFSSDPSETIWPYLMVSFKTANRFVVSPDATTVTIRIKSHFGFYLHLAVAAKVIPIPLFDIYMLDPDNAPSVQLKVAQVRPIPVFYTMTYPDGTRVTTPDELLEKARLIVYPVPLWDGDTLAPVFMRGPYIRSSLVIAAVTPDNEVLDYVKVTDVGMPLEPLNISIAPLLDELEEKGEASILLKAGWLQGYTVKLGDVGSPYELKLKKLTVKILTATGNGTYATYTVLSGGGIDLASNQVVQQVGAMLNLATSAGVMLQSLDDTLITMINQLPVELRQQANEMLDPQQLTNLGVQLFTTVLQQAVTAIAQTAVEYLISVAVAILIPVPLVDGLVSEVLAGIVNSVTNTVITQLFSLTGASTVQDVNEILMEIIGRMFMGTTLYLGSVILEIAINATMPTINSTIQSLTSTLNAYSQDLVQLATSARNTLTTIIALGAEGKPVAVVAREHYWGSATGLLDGIMASVAQIQGVNASFAVDLLSVDPAAVNGTLVFYTPYGVGALLAPVAGDLLPRHSILVPSNALLVGAAWVSMAGSALYSIGVVIGDSDRFLKLIEGFDGLYKDIIAAANQIHSLVEDINGGYVYVGLVDSGASVDAGVYRSIVPVADVVYLPPGILP